MFAATFREMDILLKSNRAILKEVGNLISNPAYESPKNDSEIKWPLNWEKQERAVMD